MAKDKNEYVAKPILREKVCEPVESGGRDDSNSLRKGWVSAVRAKEMMPNISLAPWQCDQASGKSPMISAKDWLGSKDGFVWQRSDGSLQEVTHQKSDSWRRCLGTPPLQSRKSGRCDDNRSHRLCRCCHWSDQHCGHRLVFCATTSRLPTLPRCDVVKMLLHFHVFIVRCCQKLAELPVQ